MKGMYILFFFLLATVNTFSQITAPRAIARNGMITEFGLPVGEKAPAFQKEALSGEIIDFPNNKLTIIDFWGTWCKPCIEEMPFLQDIKDFYEDNDVQILGMARDNKRQVSIFVKKHQIKWKQFVLNIDEDLLKQYRVDSYPYSYLVATDGEILATGDAVRSYSLYQNIAKYLDRDPQAFLEYINMGDVKISVPTGEYARIRINAGDLADQTRYLYESEGYFARGFNWPHEADQVELILEWIYKNGHRESKNITLERKRIKDGNVLLTID